MTAITTKIYSMEPVLNVNDMEETLEHYQMVLGFRLDWTWPDDGKAEHASVSFGTGHEGDDHDRHHFHVQLSEVAEADRPVVNSGWIYLRVDDDIDALYSEFRDRGADITYEIGDRPWGMREFDVADNNGHVFRFAKPVPEDQH